MDIVGLVEKLFKSNSLNKLLSLFKWHMWFIVVYLAVLTLWVHHTLPDGSSVMIEFWGFKYSRQTGFRDSEGGNPEAADSEKPGAETPTDSEKGEASTFIWAANQIRENFLWVCFR